MNSRIITALSLIFLAACGGGGGGGDDSEFFGGVWDVSFSPTKNLCNVAGVEPFTQSYTVNQDDTRVVVESDSGRTYVGVPNPDGFTSARTERVENVCTIPGTAATINSELIFANVRGSTAAVTRNEKSQCERSNRVCEIEFVGSAVRRN